MLPSHRLIPFLSLLVVAGEVQAQTSDLVEGPVPAEVAAFRTAADRFSTRMQELDQDTQAFLKFREAEEREKLVGGYDALIANLEGIEESRRDLTVERFEEFLERYPSAPYSSHVRFRLADLKYEVAALSYLDNTEAYFDALEGDDLEALEDLVEPSKDLSQPIALYQQIIADNEKLPPEERYERLDGVYLMLGFCYADETSMQRDDSLARSTYEDLIRVLPESDLADRSHLFIGNYKFADGEFDSAIEEYQFVYEKGDDGPYFMDALYQLAWAYYKQNRFDDAMEMFISLLDRSEQKKLDSGRESPFAPDSIKYMAYSFTDVAAQGTTSSVDVAKQYFEMVGERDYEWEIYVEMADALMRYFRFDEAIEVYQHLQDDPRWMDRPENPGFQIAIVNLYARPEVGDLEGSGSARLVLTERYNEGSEWWEANRNDPDALAKARDFIESSLLDVAIEYYVRAQESGSPEDFLIAAGKFQEYLDKFPIADDYYEQQWYLAQAYNRGGDLVSAESEFERLIRSARYHSYGDGAVYSLMDVRLQHMLAKNGSPDKAPEGSEVESNLEAADGTSVPVYAVTEDRTNFIEAADQVLAHAFSTQTTEEELPDYSSAVEERRSKLMYVPAQILFYHNRFDEARPRLEQIIEEQPRTIEASYAAGLLVDSYLAVGDLQSVRNYSKRFSLDPPGPLSDTPDDRFLNTLEGATFKLALQQAEMDDYEGAAESFLSFTTEFPESQYVADALHNSAYYYQQFGKKDRANELYEQFVNQFPDHENSRRLYFRIAANYEATFDLEKAVDFYERLRRRFPEDVNAADALYNASFLQIGLGQYEAAAAGFERYAREYSDREDREEVHFMAGEQYEQFSPDKAMAFYKRYLREYDIDNPNHAIEAQYRISEILEEKGQDRAYERQLQEIIGTFEEIMASGAELGASGHKYASTAEFPRLLEMYEDFIDEELENTRNSEDRDAKILTEIKPEELKAFKAEADAFIAKYKDFGNNTGALYLTAMVGMRFADLGLSVKPPPGLSEEEEWAFLDILEQSLYPQYYQLEEASIARLSDLVDAAKKQKKHSKWIDMALEEMNRRRPVDYPAVKAETLGIPDPRIPIELLPSEMEIPEEPEEGEGTEEATAPAETGPVDGSDEGSEESEADTTESEPGSDDTSPEEGQ